MGTKQHEGGMIMTVKAFPSGRCQEGRFLTFFVRMRGAAVDETADPSHTHARRRGPRKELAGLHLWFPWTTFLMSVVILVLPFPERESGDLHSVPGFHYCITIAWQHHLSGP